MKYFFEFKEEARKDIIETAAWYRDKRTDLDKIFLLAIEKAISRIKNNPAAGRKIYKAFREISLKKFPYVIIYEIIFNTIVIYQVFNTWQNPKKKIKRLKK